MSKWSNWAKFVLPVVLAYVLSFLIVLTLKNYVNLSTADTLSLAQLVLSMLLLPTVVIGFTITVQAFRESQELPDLDVFFETETGLLEKSLKFNSSKIFKRRKEWSQPEFFTGTINPPSLSTEIPISLVIKNEGNVIALWYAMSINIQFDADTLNLYLNWTQFYRTSGEHWQINLAELNKNKRFEAMFMSNGTLASYPNLPLKVCEMNTGWFLEEKSPTKEYQIFYTIVTERGHKRQGSLKLIFST